MTFRKVNSILWILAALPLLVSCKEGVVGGSIVKSFGGIASHKVLSPTAIELNWLQQEKYKEYQVFELGKAEPLHVSIFDGFTVENLTANTEYVFKVIAIDENGESFGGENELRVKTMPNFSGITSVERDVDNNIVINWDFSFEVYRYHIFTNDGSKPTVITTSNWQSNTALTTSDKRSYTFKDLSGSTNYYFQVHVEYRKDEFGRPDQEISEATAASFPDPLFTLPAVTIGSLPFASVSPIVNSNFTNENYTSQFFHGVDALSDPLTGVGVLSFLESANLSLGRIDNITLKVNYNDGTIDETFTKNNLTTYIKGIDPHLDLPTSQSGSVVGPAKMGQSMASGDFNCDGFKDLAVGMPESSIGSLGVSSYRAGAVYVYYSFTDGGVTKLFTGVEPKVEPVNKGKDPQIITFSDSVSAEAFGFSMSSGGNLNGDTLGGNPCEDLVVGAPYGRTGVNKELVTGAAFVFFGNKNGLAASQTISNVQENIGTCNGVVEDSSCSAVRIWPDYSKWPSSVFPSGYDAIYDTGPNGTGWTYTTIEFGYSVNFIGDFNADGYDDIAIGAPDADWDGEVIASAPGEKAYLQDVGFVAIYFGSKYGIGSDNVDKTDTAAKFPFVKIFPPVPQSGMRFGASISNGADVNGNHRIFGTDGKYHGGSDFVVGAPGFYYPNPNPGSIPNNYDAKVPVDGGWTSDYSTATSYYGFPQNDMDEKTGAAFLFFGRDHPGLTKTTVVDTESARADFWDCKSRLTNPLKQNHYSCLSDPADFRILFPRNAESEGFGHSVAILGARSFYDENSVNPITAIDANGDGFGDIVVAARDGKPEGSSLNGSGVLWQYFGNRQKAYEHNYLSQGLGGGAAGQYMVGNANCDSFSPSGGDVVANTLNCRPTLLQSNSFRAGASLGHLSDSMTVGQITSDGLLDLVVGAPFDNANGANAGAVLLFTSDTTRGLTSNFKKLYSTAGGDDTQMGYSVAVGNFDGDLNGSAEDYNDVAAGGPGDDSFRAGSGSAHLFLTNGFHISSFKSDSDTQLYDNLASPQSLHYQNTYVVGDINGDGFDDAVGHIIRYDSVGNQVYDGVTYFGSQDGGLVTTVQCLAEPSKYLSDVNTAHCYPSVSHDPGAAKPGMILPQLVPKFETQSDLWAKFGRPAGDVNGDGFADVIFYDDTSTGRQVLLYFGSSSGLLSTDRPQWIPVSNNPQIVTAAVLPASDNGGSNNVLGHNLYRYDWLQNGDFNNDGYSDIVLLNARAHSPRMDPGAPYGGGAGWNCPGIDPADTETQAECAEGEPIEYHGKAVIIYGSPLGLQTPSLDTDNFSFGQDIDFDNVVPGTYLDIYGTESAGPTGKPCQSGKCKVTVIENPVFENVAYGYTRLGHRFGASSAVIDTDNNSFDDLFVGAPEFEDVSCYAIEDNINTPLNYGRVYIFRGTADGLVAALRTDYFSNNLATSCPAANTPGVDLALDLVTNIRALQPSRIENPGVTTENERKNRQFGYSMSSAGDVNGDGIEDLIVGAPLEDNLAQGDQGNAYLFYGPICNTDNNRFYAESYAQAQENINIQVLPTSPSFPTGSVPFATDCPTSAGKLTWQKFVVKGAEGVSRSGLSLEGARKGKGDVNGDGYDDIIIGSPYWDDDFNSVVNVGRGVVYFGSAQGLYTEDFPSINVIANDQGQLRPFSMQPPVGQAYSYFFSNSISMGDFNNDQTADMLVPSLWHDGEGVNKGINLGAFFLFY